jgi:hypothetical protein
MPPLHPDKRKALSLALAADSRRREAAKNPKRAPSPTMTGDGVTLIDRLAYNLQAPGLSRGYFAKQASG